MSKTCRVRPTILLATLSVLWMLPVAAVVYEAVVSRSVQALPRGAAAPGIARAAAITFLVSLVSAVASCTFGAMAGYALSAKRFYGMKLLLGALLGAMFLPASILMVPVFRVAASLGIYDTIAALVLPSCVTAFSVVFMKAAIDRISPDIFHAARIDGLGESAIFVKIVLPLVRGPIIALGVIEFVAGIGAMAVPMAVVDSPRNYTLTLRLLDAMGGINPPPPASLIVILALIAIPSVVLFIAKWGDIISGLLAALFRYERVDE
ncbi:MAG TPA: ABC transporter permease subunit [Planctomycetota bacterium]|nr:ABC transporter permease subunit [Planctomycetota bacterium]